MIIKYINEGAFGSYKDKTPKEDKLEKLKKETGNIIEKSIRDGFLKKVKPYVEEKYQEILYNIDPWYVNDTLRLGFVEDPKEIGLELKDSNNPRIDYELIVKIPVIHLEKADLAVKPVPRDRREMQDSLPGVMHMIYNYFQYADKINNCYKEYFSEIYPDKEHYTLHLIPTLHLLNHEIENYAIFGLTGIEALKHVKEFFFSWFDNYQIRCKKFTLQCERLKFENCELLSEIFNNHIMCDQIFLYRCNASELKSIKGLEKILSFEKLPNRNYHIDIRFISSFTTKPGIGLKYYEQPCSEKLVRDVTGKSYDDNIFEHRIASVDDPKDWTEEDLISYQVSHTKMTMITFNIDRNGTPIKGEYEVGVGSSIF